MRIHTTIDIACPIETVFDFLTTPANWPVWHPASLGVRGATDHSVEPGEQVMEDFRIAGQPGSAVWTVRERQAPERWVIDGISENGNQATITYTLTRLSQGTRFERELDFASIQPRGPQQALADLNRHMEQESAEALRRVKNVLEGGPRA